MAASFSSTFTPLPQIPPPKLTKPISIQSSHRPHQPPTLSLKTHLSSLLKPTFITLTAVAALLLSRHPSPSPSLAAAIPAATTTSHSPQQTQSLRSLMDLNIKSHNFPKAIEIIDSIISLENPITPDLLLLKSHLQIQSGDLSSARHSLEHLISQNPFSVEAYHGLVMACRETGEELGPLLERIENAMMMCKKEKREEDLRDFKLLKAEIKVVEGKYEEAIKVYQEIVREDSGDFRPYLCEGIVYTMMGRQEEAERAFEKYRKVKPRGHQCACYFDDNVVATKVFGQLGEENKRKERAGLNKV